MKHVCWAVAVAVLFCVTLYAAQERVIFEDRFDGKPAPEKTVQLRLIVTKDSFTARFRPDAKGDFQTAAEGALPPGADEQLKHKRASGIRRCANP